jgi:hypothetical protein
MAINTYHGYKTSQAREPQVIHPKGNVPPSKSIHEASVYVINPAVEGDHYQSIKILRQPRPYRE